MATTTNSQLLRLAGPPPSGWEHNGSRKHPGTRNGPASGPLHSLLFLAGAFFPQIPSRFVPHLLQVLSQIPPFQWGLPQPQPHSPYPLWLHCFSLAFHIFLTSFFVHHLCSQLEHKFYEVGDVLLFCSSDFTKKLNALFVPDVHKTLIIGCFWTCSCSPYTSPQAAGAFLRRTF